MYLYIPEFVFKFVLETVEFLPTEWRLLLRVSNKFSDDDDNDVHDDDDDDVHDDNGDCDEQKYVSLLESQINSEMIKMISTVLFKLRHFRNVIIHFMGTIIFFTKTKKCLKGSQNFLN